MRENEEPDNTYNGARILVFLLAITSTMALYAGVKIGESRVKSSLVTYAAMTDSVNTAVERLRACQLSNLRTHNDVEDLKLKLDLLEKVYGR